MKRLNGFNYPLGPDNALRVRCSYARDGHSRRFRRSSYLPDADWIAQSSSLISVNFAYAGMHDSTHLGANHLKLTNVVVHVGAYTLGVLDRLLDDAPIDIIGKRSSQKGVARHRRL
jgi:hypothetical protein